MVFQRCAGKAQTRLAVNTAHALGHFGGGILDCLRFIQHQHTETAIFVLCIVPYQQWVSGNHQVALGSLRECLVPVGAVNQGNAQLGRKLGRFVEPVAGEAGGGDDQCGLVQSTSIFHVLDQGEGLQGFTEAHVVRENAAEPVTL